MERPPGGGGAASSLGGGGAAGNLEVSLNLRNDLFLINSKCHFGDQSYIWERQLLSLCVSFSRALMLVTIEITDEMEAAECVCSAIGGWVLSQCQHACGVCSQPLTSRGEK